VWFTPGPQAPGEGCGQVDALKQQAGETVEIRELIRQIGPSELKKLKEPLTTAANRTYLIDLFEILR